MLENTWMKLRNHCASSEVYSILGPGICNTPPSFLEVKTEWAATHIGKKVQSVSPQGVMCVYVCVCVRTRMLACMHSGEEGKEGRERTLNFWSHIASCPSAGAASYWLRVSTAKKTTENGLVDSLPSFLHPSDHSDLHLESVSHDWQLSSHQPTLLWRAGTAVATTFWIRYFSVVWSNYCERSKFQTCMAVKLLLFFFFFLRNY